jgi:hypothetical protein
MYMKLCSDVVVIIQHNYYQLYCVQCSHPFIDGPWEGA